jgi:hypothetical protein
MPQIVKVTKPIVIVMGKAEKPEDIDAEPFTLRDRTKEEVADYDAEFKASSQGGHRTKARVMRRIGDGQTPRNSGQPG